MRDFLPPFAAIPLPGHRASVLNEHSTTQQSLQRLAARINDQAEGEPYTLVGYSMGGRLAAWLTSIDLINPRKLVLMAASLGISAPREKDARLSSDREIARKLRQGDFRKFLEEWYCQPLFGQLRHRDFFENLLERRLLGDSQQLARALELFSIGLQPDLNRLSFRQEVLYMAGGNDSKYSAIAAGLNGIKSEIIAGAGHAIHLDNPAEVGRIIQEMETKQ